MLVLFALLAVLAAGGGLWIFMQKNAQLAADRRVVAPKPAYRPKPGTAAPGSVGDARPAKREFGRRRD